MSDMDVYKSVFLSETSDYLQQIVDALLAIESDPSAREPIETAFRAAHSLKGMAGAMGYGRTAELTHQMEGLFDRVRKGELVPDVDSVGLMLSAVDLIRDLVDDESSGQEQVDPSEMIAALSEATSAEKSASEVRDQPECPLWRLRITLEEACVLKGVRAYLVIKRLAQIAEVVDTVPTAAEIEDERFDRSFEVLVAQGPSPESLETAALGVGEIESVEVIADQSRGRTRRAGTRRRADSIAVPKLSDAQTVRVSIGHLDTLVDLVGELVVLRSRLKTLAASIGDDELKEAVENLRRISGELRYEVMQTRMVPVSNVFNRFPRMVRDLAAELGKKVTFEMEGLDIELDRTVLDEIGDTLVHLLRNSIDHGIEPPEARLAAAKREEGRIRLSANREREYVEIEVSDDGHGIDVDRVWAKAVECGIVSASDRAGYDERDILLLTCVPGFSTAEHATKVSGRGVGMDVVKDRVEGLGGTLQIESAPSGTRFVLRLPGTLAIVQALLVRSAGQALAIPLSAVDEVHAAGDLTLDTVDGATVVIMRDGRVTPLHRLDSLLLAEEPAAPLDGRASVLIVRVGGEARALQVDALEGRSEIVVKPLTELLRRTKGFSGATVTGDGRVLLVIDPRTIFEAEEV